MRVRGQTVIETDKYFFIRLKEPYWSAWQKYDFEKGVEGFGIAREVINQCIENKKKLRVRIAKYATYEIGYLKLQKEMLSKRRYLARDNKVVYVLPRTAFDKVVYKVKQVDIAREDKRSKSIQEALF